MDLDTVTRPWFDAVRRQAGCPKLFDAHTHLGHNDPDGFKQAPAELEAVLDAAGAIGCFVFPMHEPDGYPEANDRVLAIAAAAGPRFVPFCRVNPFADAPAEARRALAAGARGIKLHPRAEGFTLDHPALREVFAIADEQRVPILIHAGRGIPALGVHAVALAREFPNARVILAHAGVSDLAWLWQVARELPNLLFDSAWWMPADLLTLFALVPPGQIVFASDAPYGSTMLAATGQLRLALQVGLTAEQIRIITSEQSLRIAAREPLLDGGPAVGEQERDQHLLLDRLAELLQMAAQLSFRGAPEAGAEMLALARQACAVPDDIEDAPIFAAIVRLLDSYERLAAESPDDHGLRSLLTLAATVAKTPDVPVPDLETAPAD
jgi:predicted TIM-barrel fold metal-dependent hydrolase